MLFSRDLNNEKVLTTLSVRSAFDLFLQVCYYQAKPLQSRKYPKGSEVIMTGVNIPDMYQIVLEHGLIPVPLEINPETMEPISVDAMKELITDKVLLAPYNS